MEQKQQNSIKFVCLSDTHNRQKDLKIPDGDVLIHAGDFTNVGDTKEMQEFIEFIKNQPHKHKIVIAGNHDLSLDIEKFDTFMNNQFQYYFKEKQTKEQWIEQKQQLSSVCTYLEDEMVELYGYKIYGSPYSVEFYGWAFMKEIPDLKPIWQNIPTDTDILITHGPPHSILDKCKSGDLAGCPNLKEEVLNRIKPLYHIFGHIHETYGTQKINETTFINASNVNYNYKPTNEPIVFELPIKN